MWQEPGNGYPIEPEQELEDERTARINRLRELLKLSTKVQLCEWDHVHNSWGDPYSDDDEYYLPDVDLEDEEEWYL